MPGASACAGCGVGALRWGRVMLCCAVLCCATRLAAVVPATLSSPSRRRRCQHGVATGYHCACAVLSAAGVPAAGGSTSIATACTAPQCVATTRRSYARSFTSFTGQLHTFPLDMIARPYTLWHVYGGKPDLRIKRVNVSHRHAKAGQWIKHRAAVTLDSGAPSPSTPRP